MLGKFVIAGFEVFIGLAFILFGATISFYHYPTLGIVVFFVGVASFAGIPVLIKKVAKGIKLFMIISVIQIGTIISCWIFEAPGMGGPSLGDDLLGKELEGIGLILGLPLAVLFILVIASRRL
tara:strand:- start:120 stop:488 length:369 start_codon:yes stop_codon:yes gene_type:complete